MKHPTTPALIRRDASAAIRRFGVSPRTHGVPVLPPDAPDDAWLAARRAGLGASETAGVMGLSPHSSAFSIWWQKAHGFDVDSNDAMHIGSKLEPVIGELFAEARPDVLVFRPGARLWRHPEHEWMLATPDFFAVTQDNPHRPWPLECKSDEGGAWGIPGTDDVPLHHKIQVVQQMAVLGVDTGYLMRLAGKRATLYVVRWTADVETLYRAMVSAGRAFMATVDAGVAPDIDGHEATTTALIWQHPAVDKDTEETIPDGLVAAYRDAIAAENNAKAEKRRLANEIRSRIGRAEYAVDPDGYRVAQRRVYKRRESITPAGMVDGLWPITPNPYI